MCLYNCGAKRRKKKTEMLCGNKEYLPTLKSNENMLEEISMEPLRVSIPILPLFYDFVKLTQLSIVPMNQMFIHSMSKNKTF